MGLLHNIRDLSKDEQIRVKAVICAVGIALIFLIAALLYGGGSADTDTDELPEDNSEVITEYFTNVLITELTDSTLSFFDGENRSYKWQENDKRNNFDVVTEGQIADITVTDGEVSTVHRKDTEKISGKVVSVEENGVTLEHAGFIPFDEAVRFYMLYGELRTGSAGDIRIGYRFADFCIENGRVNAVLLTRDETMEYIRVQIKSSDYAGAYHDTVILSCDTDFVLRYTDNGEIMEELHTAGESIEIAGDSRYFTGEEEGSRITILPTALTGRIALQSVSRSRGIPSYRGTMELINSNDGIVLINEVLLEEYLYAVVPSEMPSSYPTEALKAQAICARTYAYAHMLRPGLPGIGAHVDDSTGYQVYNNIVEQEETTRAVKDTAGQLLLVDGELVSTFYYSTSCGFGSDEHAWKGEGAPELTYLTARSLSRAEAEGETSIYTADSMKEEAMFAQFLDYPPETDFEKNEPWYRWHYEAGEVKSDRMLSVLQSRYQANNRLVLTLKDGEYVSMKPEKLGELTSITVLKRNAGGAADEILIEGEKASYKVISELNIRYVLCDGETYVLRQDGSTVEMKSLLPSAFFVVLPVQKDGKMIKYTLYGGGFGHGAGMSQNGAKNMALAGYTAEQILTFFYHGSSVQRMEQM